MDKDDAMHLKMETSRKIQKGHRANAYFTLT